MLDTVDAALGKVAAEPEAEELVLPADATPLEFLQAVYRSSAQPMTHRLKAATAAASFVHPKLSVSAHVEGFAQMMKDNARLRGRSNVIDARANHALSHPGEPEPSPSSDD